MNRIFILIIISFNLPFSFVFSQSTYIDPVAYLDKVSEGHSKVQKEVLGYMSAVSHGKSAKKVSKQRAEMMTALSVARARLSNMQGFKGDTTLRHKSYSYFNTSYLVLKEDYGKIMDLEEIAEQSYDNMEAYINTQSKAQEKVNQAFDDFDKEYRFFAASNKIIIKDEETEESKKIMKSGEVIDYYNSTFLAFYKCNITEVHMIDAIGKKDISSIEQNKTALHTAIKESTAKLDSLGSFRGDASIITTIKKVIDFYQSEISTSMNVVKDYLKKSEKFEKLKAALDKKSSSERTNEDIETFNAAVGELNDVTNLYNKTINEMNTSRNKLINEMNKVNSNFLDKHMPVYNK